MRLLFLNQKRGFSQQLFITEQYLKSSAGVVSVPAACHIQVIPLTNACGLSNTSISNVWWVTADTGALGIFSVGTGPNKAVLRHEIHCRAGKRISTAL
jgi:hypothetical protein